MKTIGMVGSVSWQATIEYYRIINEEVGARLGGHHCAKIVMACADFEILVNLAVEKRWEELAGALAEQVHKLKAAGADFGIICANTMHKFADGIEADVGLPLVHIVEETAKAIVEPGMKKAALLGTVMTMEDGFYQERMARHGIEIVVPEAPDRQFIHRNIIEELTRGIFSPEAKKKYLAIVDSLMLRGAEGVILGCTEIPLLIHQKDISLPLFDTTAIHARAAVAAALA